MFQYTMWMFVHLTYLVLSSETLFSDLNKIMLFVCLPQQIWFISDQKLSCCFFAFNTSKMNIIPQPQEQKSGRRQTQCSSTLCGCQCTQLIWCCPLQPFQMRYFVVHFWSKILLFCACNNSKMHIILQPQEQEGCRRQTQCSSTLYYGCYAMLVHPTHLVLSSDTLSNEIFCCSF